MLAAAVRQVYQPAEVQKLSDLTVAARALLSGDITQLKSAIRAMEIEWDKNEAGWKPRDPSAWTVLDGTLDSAFTSIRRNPPNLGLAQAAFTDLANELQQSTIGPVVSASSNASGRDEWVLGALYARRLVAT